jgi:hypothetical protein
VRHRPRAVDAGAKLVFVRREHARDRRRPGRRPSSHVNAV